MTVRKLIGKILYNAIGIHMPPSLSKVNLGSRRFRAFCGRLILRECGKNVNIEKGARFSPEVSLGDNSGIGINANIPAHVTIGREVMMGPDCMMFTSNHNINDLTVPMGKQGDTAAEPIVIEDDVWIGARVIILPGVRVGTGSVIGAGSVVTHDVAPYSIVAGNPAKLIRMRK